MGHYLFENWFLDKMFIGNVLLKNIYEDNIYLSKNVGIKKIRTYHFIQMASFYSHSYKDDICPCFNL